MLERDVGGDVLDEQLHAEEILGFATWRASSSTASSVAGSGSRSLKYSPPAWPQQACSETSAGSKRRIARLHPRQVLAVDAVGRTQTEPDAVQAQRVVRAGALQRAHRGAAIVKIVFGVRLDECRRPGRSSSSASWWTDLRPIPARAGIGPRGTPRESRRDIGRYIAFFSGMTTLPPIFSHSPFGTYFHSPGSLSPFAWPAQE